MESQFTAISLKAAATQLRGWFLRGTLSFLAGSPPLQPGYKALVPLCSLMLCGPLWTPHVHSSLFSSGKFSLLVLTDCPPETVGWLLDILAFYFIFFFCFYHIFGFCGIFKIKTLGETSTLSVFSWGLFVRPHFLLLTVTSTEPRVAAALWSSQPGVCCVCSL